MESVNNSEFFNSLDYIYILITFISCLFGFLKGFTKDFFSTCAWIGSGFISAFISPFLVDTFKENLTKNILLAKIIAITASYLVVLITLLLLINTLSIKIKNTSLSGVDRALGCLFGFVRGFLIILTMAMIYVFFNMPCNKYEFINNSKITPHLISIANWITPKIMNYSPILNEIKPKYPSSYENNKKRHLSEQLRSNKIIKEKLYDEDDSYTNKVKTYIDNIFSRYLNRDENKDYIENRKKLIRKKARDKNIEFGAMSLMRAKAERKAQKKAKKLQKDILKQLDNKR